MDTKVQVQGLGQLRSALRKVQADLPKELNVEFGRIAEQVAARVRPLVPHRSGKAAASVQGKSGGKIAFGGRQAEYYPWLDFGGRVGRGRSVIRPIVSGGRYVYPTIADSRDLIEGETEKAIERVLKHAELSKD